MSSSSRYLLNACRAAERQHQYVARWLRTGDVDGVPIRAMKEAFYETLRYLREQGIGGVMIDGKFRSTLR